MRLGISSSLGFVPPAQWAKTLVELGCKSVVFPVDSTADEALINEYVKEAKANDLLIAEVGIWRNALATDENERKANLEYSINQLKLAEKVGARCAVNVAGAFGPRWDGGYKENFTTEAFDKTVEMIRTVIDAVNPVNTTFSIESMPWMIPTGPEEYLKLIEAVDRKQFSVHLDIINMINSADKYFNRDEFLEHCFDILGNRIVSCHLKDIKLLDGYTFQLKECACGEGDFNIKRYMELASAVDPDMPMIIEHLPDDNAYRESTQYVLSL